jgi:hypothetical protein
LYEVAVTTPTVMSGTEEKFPAKRATVAIPAVIAYVEVVDSPEILEYEDTPAVTAKVEIPAVVAYPDTVDIPAVLANPIELVIVVPFPIAL